MTNHHHHHSPLASLGVLGVALGALGAAVWVHRHTGDALASLSEHVHNDLGVVHQRINALGQGAMMADAHIATVLNEQGVVLGQMREDKYGPGPGPHD